MSKDPKKMEETKVSAPSAFYNVEGETKVTCDGVPHWDQLGKLCFITWRLSDSLPESKLQEFRMLRKEWIQKNPKPWTVEQEQAYREAFHDKIDSCLDQGAGDCIFKHAEARKVFEDVLLEMNEDAFQLEAYVIMPNHVHLLLRLDAPLSEVMKRLKGKSSRCLNLHLGKSGKLWQRSFYDTLIRSSRHLRFVLAYIHRNPEKLSPSTYSLWFNSEEWRLQSPRNISERPEIYFQEIIEKYAL